MKRSVQILLFATFMVSVFSAVGEETIEERKRRITRKYLRERMDLTYSDEVVPGESAEQEEVLASEIFKEPQVELSREEPGATVPPPRLPPPQMETENRNWLLSEPTETADPFADPFAVKDAEDEPKKNDWTTWGTEREPLPYGSRRENRFNGRNQEAYPEQQSQSYSPWRQNGVFNPRAPVEESVQQQYPQQRNSYARPYDGINSTQESGYDSTFSRRPQQQNPFSRETSPSSTQSFVPELKPRAGSYTPYRSPYETQREQRKNQWNSYGAPEQEYRRQDPYQQWKEKNHSPFDPMGDDVFINETVPKLRR